MSWCTFVALVVVAAVIAAVLIALLLEWRKWETLRAVGLFALGNGCLLVAPPAGDLDNKPAIERPTSRATELLISAVCSLAVFGFSPRSLPR